MALINEDYLKLPDNYLFTEIARKVNIFKVTRPGSRVIRLDAGDTDCIVSPSVSDSINRAIEEKKVASDDKSGDKAVRMRLLVSNILRTDYESRGIHLEEDDITFNETALGAPSDVCDMLSKDNIMGVVDPSYPAFIYQSVMNGRAGEQMDNGRWSNLVYIPITAENNFIPVLPKEKIDVLYLSLPNNPTGSTLTTDELKKWVKYATDNHTLIIFDASHSHYVRNKKVPRSIYEIKGAQKVAVELRSFSKVAGYTGTHFAYTVIPKDLTVYTEMGEPVLLNKLWHKRLTSRFTGLSSLSLAAAESLYSNAGQKQLKELTEYYMDNTRMLRDALIRMGLKVWGGEDSPYIWVKCPDGQTSWRFFEQILYNYSVVCTPGVGFCPGGEGYVRFTGFAKKESIEEAVSRFSK